MWLNFLFTKVTLNDSVFKIYNIYKIIIFKKSCVVLIIRKKLNTFLWRVVLLDALINVETQWKDFIYFL